MRSLDSLRCKPIGVSGIVRAQLHLLMIVVSMKKGGERGEREKGNRPDCTSYVFPQGAGALVVRSQRKKEDHLSQNIG